MNKPNSVAPATHEDLVWVLSDINTRLQNIESVVPKVDALVEDAAQRQGRQHALAFVYSFVAGVASFLATWFMNQPPSSSS